MGAQTVLIPQDIYVQGRDYLLQKGYRLIGDIPVEEQSLIAAIQEADAAIVRTAVFTRRVIEAGKRLKIIARFGVGTDNIDLRAAAERGVIVTVAKNCNTVSVAEHALMLLLACAKRLVYCHGQAAKGDWEVRNRSHGIELKEKTLGIVGLGAIGLELARKAHYGLDMRVIGYTGGRAGALPGYIESVDSLGALFERADAVSLHIPGRESNEGLINAGLLRLMKRGAILINTARGSVADEEALIDCLRENLLFYGTDVFTREPPPAGHPLLSLENVVLTPHNAGLTAEAAAAMSLSAAKAVDDVLSGRRPQYPLCFTE